MMFVGSREDYNQNDAILFFEGEKFWSEWLHWAVKQLRHLRQPGKSVAAVSVPPSLLHFWFSQKASS